MPRLGVVWISCGPLARVGIKSPVLRLQSVTYFTPLCKNNARFAPEAKSQTTRIFFSFQRDLLLLLQTCIYFLLLPPKFKV